MDVEEKGQAPQISGGRITRFIVGAVFAGILMAIRHEISSIWLRALLGGCAIAVLLMFVFRPGRQN